MRRIVVLFAIVLGLFGFSVLPAMGAAVVWNVASGGNGHSYEIITLENPISWTDAEAASEALGGRLSTITSVEESNFMWNLAPQHLTTSGAVWLGGYRNPPVSDANLNWHWVTGETWSYTQWQPYPDYPGVDLSLDYLAEFHDYAGRDGWGDGANFNPDNQNYAYAVEFDEFTVPEPGTLLVLAPMTLSLLRVRRRP